MDWSEETSPSTRHLPHSLWRINDLNVFYCWFEMARLTPNTRSDLHFTHSPTPTATPIAPSPTTQPVLKVCVEQRFSKSGLRSGSGPGENSLYGYKLGLHGILHAIVMRISSVKTVLWLAVNLHQLFSNGAAFNTQSLRSLTSNAISRSLSHAIHLRFWARNCVACQWTTALCIKCRSIWKQADGDLRLITETSLLTSLLQNIVQP